MLIIKRRGPQRDQTLISAVSSTLGNPRVLSDMCPCVCECVGWLLEETQIQALLVLYKWKCLLTLQEACSDCKAHLFHYVGLGAFFCLSVKKDGTVPHVRRSTRAAGTKQEPDRLHHLVQLLLGETVSACPDSPLPHHHLSTLVITASVCNYLPSQLGKKHSFFSVGQLLIQHAIFLLDKMQS